MLEAWLVNGEALLGTQQLAKTLGPHRLKVTLLSHKGPNHFGEGTILGLPTVIISKYAFPLKKLKIEKIEIRH